MFKSIRIVLIAACGGAFEANATNVTILFRASRAWNNIRCGNELRANLPKNGRSEMLLFVALGDGQIALGRPVCVEGDGQSRMIRRPRSADEAAKTWSSVTNAAEKIGRFRTTLNRKRLFGKPLDWLAKSGEIQDAVDGTRIG